MDNGRKLVLVKLVHTLIWIFYNVVIWYYVYAAVAGHIDHRVWICISLIVIEGLVLLVFNKICPVTIIARRYSDSTRDNFDIYLPNWLAKYNKLIYTSIVIVATVILIFRLVMHV